MYLCRHAFFKRWVLCPSYRGHYMLSSDIEDYVSHIGDRKEFQVKSLSSRHSQCSETIATKWISKDENTHVKATLRKRHMSIFYYCPSPPQTTFLRTVFYSTYAKETKPHLQGLVNQDTSHLLIQKVQLPLFLPTAFRKRSKLLF